MSSESGSLSAWNFSPGKRLLDAAFLGRRSGAGSPADGGHRDRVRLTSPDRSCFASAGWARRQAVRDSEVQDHVHRPQRAGLGVHPQRRLRVTAMGRVLAAGETGRMPELFNVLRAAT